MSVSRSLLRDLRRRLSFASFLPVNLQTARSNTVTSDESIHVSFWFLCKRPRLCCLAAAHCSTKIDPGDILHNLQAWYHHFRQDLS